MNYLEHDCWKEYISRGFWFNYSADLEDISRWLLLN
jgi:hypothetical protein